MYVFVLYDYACVSCSSHNAVYTFVSYDYVGLRCRSNNVVYVFFIIGNAGVLL